MKMHEVMGFMFLMASWFEIVDQNFCDVPIGPMSQKLRLLLNSARNRA
jgi:hypothetical protein